MTHMTPSLPCTNYSCSTDLTCYCHNPENPTSTLKNGPFLLLWTKEHDPSTSLHVEVTTNEWESGWASPAVQNKLILDKHVVQQCRWKLQFLKMTTHESIIYSRVLISCLCDDRQGWEHTALMSTLPGIRTWAFLVEEGLFHYTTGLPTRKQTLNEALCHWSQHIVPRT